MGRHSLKVPRAGGGLRALRGRRLQREGETETEEEKQRWAEMGRMAGRQVAGEFKKKLKKIERKAQGLVEAVIFRSPSPSSK